MYTFYWIQFFHFNFILFLFFILFCFDSVSIMEHYKHMQCLFHWYWKPEGAHMQEVQICLTEVI